ncbi:MAG: ATP-binding protein [Desulfococcaceae bacterium]|jgi:ATP-dependent DNA helicase RecG|nr:ATP-binding protein [Desulfococcaceae bacterium]
MKSEEILTCIKNGENSGIEFKQDGIRSEQLAKEMVAFLNFKGGKILVGVNDDGSVSGISRKDMEQWVMNVCTHLIHPRIIPYYEEYQIDDKKSPLLP